MTKGQLNFIIDAVMFLALAAIAGLGLLMEYIMPPGRRLWEIYGSNPYITWLGWDRHDRGDIHFYLALAFWPCWFCISSCTGVKSWACSTT